MIEDYSSNNNSEQIRRLPLQQHNFYKSGQYTPLIDMNHEHIWEQVQLVQASQPNLCINFNRDDHDNNNIIINARKNNNNIQNNSNYIDECSSFGHIVHRKESLTYHEKAFSLTDLNSQKTEIKLCDRDNNNNNKVKKSNMINYCKIKNFNKSESTSSPANNNNNTSVRLQQNDEEQHARRRQQQQSGPVRTKTQKPKQKTSTVPISNKNQCTTLESIQTEISTKTTVRNLNTNNTNNDNNSYCTVSFV
ncbi:unnamed protein product [Trichobilharzia regenti]|nr:unnamed protein product [Trichobilharzia regenti]